MMEVSLNDSNIAGESSIRKKGKQVCSSNAESSESWPYKVKLTTDSMRWDCLKILPSSEFSDHILSNMSKDTLETLNAWRPAEVSIYDVDTDETYKANLVKKEPFWFEPFPDVVKRKEKSACCNVSMMQCHPYNSQERRKTYFFSLQPFRHIVTRRHLCYDQEIGFRWSGGSKMDTVEFSVLYVPK